MAAKTLHIIPDMKRAFILCLFILTTALHGQMTITSSPAAVNDTIAICNSGTTSVTFSSSSSTINKYQWTFAGASPSADTGAGPHLVNFALPGTYSVQVIGLIDTIPTDTANLYVVIAAPTSVTFNPTDTVFCRTAGPDSITGFSPPGGYFTGPGVVGGSFDPAAAGLGTHKIIYTYQNGPCTDTVSRIFTVLNTPNPQLAAQGSPIMFNGQLTYTRCLPANSTFQFYTTTPASSYTSYSIDFGDGSAPQTGTTFPTPALTYSYAGTGFYKVALTLYGGNGCPATDTIKVFYGGNPAVGLATKGSSVKCLPKDSTGITIWFDILKTASNPPGTIYTVVTNDGSPPVTYMHPPPDSISHTFFEPSCGYSSYSYANSFEIKITAQAPCRPNTTVSIEPIYISDPPTAAFEVQPRVCIGQTVPVVDQSWGSANALNGCDTNVTLVWEISPNTYSINSGYMGALNGSGNPMNWFSGTPSLGVDFHKTGYYTIRQYVGNQAGCEIDTVVQVICVDSIPDPTFGMDKDTICAPDTVTAFYLNDLITFCDTTGLQWDITPSTGYTMLTGATDSLLQAYFFASGIYTITVQSSNHCDTSQFSRTLVVQNDPTVFLPADLAFCGVREVNFANAPFTPQKYDSLAPLTYDWQISPVSGWSYINGTTSSSEFPHIDFTVLGAYTIINRVTNKCGTDVDTMVISFYDVPQIDSIPDTLICYDSDFSQIARVTGGLQPYTINWSSTPSGVSQTGDSLFLSNLTSSQTIHISVSDSLGCGDTTSFYLEVAPILRSLAGADQILCYNDTTNLLGFATGGHPPYKYKWLPAINVANDTLSTTLRYPVDSAVTYVLRVTDSLGCVAYDSVLIDVYEVLTVDAGPDIALCFDSVIYTFSSASHSGGVWSGTGVNGNTFEPLVAGVGTHKIYYEYLDINGCYYVDSLNIRVMDIPEADFYPDNNRGCSPLAVQMLDSSSIGTNHYWYINGNLASTLVSPNFLFTNQSYTQDNTITIKLVVTAGSGCRDSITKTVIVQPKPFASFTVPTSICPNDSVVATQLSTFKGVATYRWSVSSPSIFVSDTTAATPTFVFGDNQSSYDSTYTITLITLSGDGCSDTTSQNITIFARPVAGFSMPAAACAPISLSPIDTSKGKGITYQWTVSPAISITNNGKASPTFSFPASYNDSVVYTINLTVTDTNGCIDTTTGTYTVYPIPTAAFAPSVNDSCGPMNVQFLNTSASNIPGQHLADLTFAWDFGNGFTSTDSIPTTTFTNTGVADTSYYVILIVTNAFGCVDSITDTITVHPDPRAVIVQNYSVDCAPFVIDSSVVNAVQYPFANHLYIWQVLNLNDSILQSDTGLYNLNYTILLDGDSVNIRLITTSPFGCKNDTAQQLFYTITSPVANFTIVPDSGCSPLTVSVFDSSSAGVSHSWYLNDSLFSTAQNPVLNLINNSSTQDSTLTLKLIITAGTGCQDSTEQTITIFPTPVADFSIVANSCPGDTIGVTNNSSAKGATYQWSINSPAITITNDTLAQPSFIFKDSQSGFDSTYTITLLVTSANGCTDTTTQNITIFSRPVANFSLPAAACAPIAINTLDSSTGSGLNYTWTISPSVPTTGWNTANPQFNFPASFSDSVVYTIGLTVVDTNGCSDSTLRTYTVYPRPTAGFTNATLDSCSPFTIQFGNTSTPNQTGMDRTTMTFFWDAGNGMTSNDSTPVFTYTNTGVIDSSYIVTLIATNAFGCSDTVIDTVVVHPDPRAIITANRTASCAPFVIDSSMVKATAFNAANQQYYWQVLSTNRTILSQDTGLYNLNHTITASADSIIIRLIANSPFGCKSDTATQLFYTIPNPIANFSVVPDSGCSPLTVTILDSASPGANRHWYFNGVFQFTGAATNFTFVNNSLTMDSTIVLKLVVEAGTGCKDSIEKVVVVHPTPQASFTMVADGCPWDTVFTQNLSTAQAGATYLWSTNATTAWISNVNAFNPQIVFANNQSGVDSTYRVTLITTSAYGCADTVSRMITVYSRPTALFTLPAADCSPTVVNPTNQSVGSNLTYQWYSTPMVSISGAGTATPSFDFPLSTSDSVIYIISLTTTDSVTGCTDSISLPYTVYPKPQAGFMVSTKDSCGPFTINFVNTSSTNQVGMERSTMTFFWDFHNGTTSTDSVPTATFVNNGTQDTTYLITLIATNAFGCSDTITDSITVHPNPKAVITATRSANCAPFVIDSSVVNASVFTSANQQYYWQLLSTNGTLLSQDTGLANLNYNITAAADSVILRLIASSPFGCKSDTATQLLFTIPNPVANFTPVPDSGCSPLMVNILDSASPGANRHWYVNGVFHSSGAAPIFTFVNNSLTADSTITIKLVVEAGTGCKDSTERMVTIFPEPIADFSMAANRCPWDTISVTNNSLGKAGATYLWSTSSPTAWISNSTTANPQIVFGNNQSGADSTYQVTLIITSVDGCTDTITKSITIYTRPLADFTLPVAACSPITVNPTDNSSGSSLSYMWSSTPNVNITGAATSTPSFDFPLSTNDSVVYTIKLVVVDMVKGCMDSISKTFTVYPKPQAGFTVSSKDSCGPFTLDFVNTSSPNQTGMNRSSMSFFWDFHNGQTSTDSVPTVTFTNVGLQDTTYVITLIATNAFGCSDTIIDSITVHPDPKATITLLTQADCAPWLIDSSVVGNIHYPAANTSYLWEILNAKTRAVIATYNSAAAINHLLAQPGDSIIVRLTAVSIFNCKSDTVENLVYTIGKAFPGFSASVYDGCSPLTVNFTDTVPGFTAWEWYFNGALFSNLPNPTKTFTNTSFTQDSIYEIKMVPYSGFGCKDSVIQFITVYARPDVQWAAANSCLNDSVVFVNNTNSIHPITTWSWNFGDGNGATTSNPLHRYAAPGKYTVSLTATNDKGCVNVSYDTITIYPRPVANFSMSSACGADTACINQAFSLNDASTLFSLGGNITQWSWDINADGTVEYTSQNPMHTFSGTGTFPIRLIVTSQFGCSDTIEKSFYISEAPTAYFSIDSIRPCGPFNTSVTDGSFGLIDTYQWQVYVLNRQGVPTVLYSTNQRNPNPLPTFLPNYGADTTYYISQTVGNCCGSTTHLDSIVLKSMPVPRMLPSAFTGCTPFTATFQLDGLVKGRPDYLVMNYGDGVIDTLNRFYQITPSNDTIWVWGQQNHTFVNNGVHDTTFTVYLTAANDCGDSTISLNITVHPKNVQAFIGATPEQGCAPLTVTITDKSFGGSNTTWCLDYNPITGVCNQPTALGDSIIHTYTTPGTYVIAQYVTDPCSADTAYKTITVYPSPTANFTHSGATCEDNAVVFTNQSTTTATSITGYSWNFGDGTGTYLNSPTHYYQNPGTYRVCLTVMSVNGCMDSICKTVTIYSKPEVAFSAPNACLNRQPITFHDSSVAVSGQIISTIWKFGDGNSSVMPNPQHTYTTPGMYTVTLIHSNTFGCIDSARRVVNIFPISKAEFTTTNSLGKKCGAPQQINFINQSSSAAGYYWDFDFNGNRGASTSTLLNPSFIYTKDGAYNVLLVAYNANGCVDSIIKPVYIRPFPKAGFVGNVHEGCAPLTVNFSDTSVYNFNGPGRIVSWTWDFGDGTFSSGMPNVTHVYKDPGTYTVSLRVESDGGCSDTVMYNSYVIVHPTPIASFTHAEINSKTFNFVNTSQFTDKNTNYYWTFGDGKHSYEKDPRHIYNVDLFENDYIFEVCLITSNQFGCGDTICQELNLKGYLLFTPNAFAPGVEGAGGANYFLPAGHSMEKYRLQIFDEWGNVIFESTSLDENGVPNEPWDGKHSKKGTELPMGAYVWKIEAVFNDGTIWEGKEYGKNVRKPYGTVTLIR